jgi:hypothetical protein
MADGGGPRGGPGLEPLEPQASTFSDWFERWISTWEPRSDEQLGPVDDSTAATLQIGHILRRVESALELGIREGNPVHVDDLLRSFSIIAVWEYDRIDERLHIVSIRLERFYLNTLDEDAELEILGSALIEITISGIETQLPPLAFTIECAANADLDKEPTPNRRALSEELRAFEDEFGRSNSFKRTDVWDERMEDSEAETLVLPHLAESVIDFVRRNLQTVDRLSVRCSEALSSELQRNSTDHGAVAALVALEDEIWRLEANIDRVLRDGSTVDSNLLEKFISLANTSLRLKQDIPSSWHESPYLWPEDHPYSLAIVGAMPYSSGTCHSLNELFQEPSGFDPFSGLTADSDKFAFEVTFVLDVHSQVTLRILEPARTTEGALPAGTIHCSRVICLPELSRWLLMRLWAGMRLANVEVHAFSIGAIERLLETERWNNSPDAIWPTPDRPRPLPF